MTRKHNKTLIRRIESSTPACTPLPNPQYKTRNPQNHKHKHIYINTSHRQGMRSDLAPWTETARGASRACSASASPPSGFPARRAPKKRTQNSDQISKRRNQIKSNQTQPGTPRPEPNQRDHPDGDPTPKGE